jgi:uncharacterized protein (TIGR02646 family)
MINLVKGPKPAILEANDVAWTQVLVEKIEKGEKPTDNEKNKYRHADIKAALIKETFGKCAYCESKLLHITYGDIEHIIPKSLQINKTFDWNNLTLACDKCNTNKTNSDVNHDNFVDPYIHNPSEYFYFAGPLLLNQMGKYQARMMEIKLDLNRAELFEKRREKINYLKSLADTCFGIPDADSKKAVLEDIIKTEMADSVEFALLSRTILQPLVEEIQATLAQ